MVMKARTITRHLRESLKSIRRNKWMTFASVSAVTVTLLLVGVFLSIMMNLNKVATNIEEDVEIKVFVDLAADDAAVKALEKQLKETEGLAEVRLSTKEDELKEVSKNFGDELGLYEQDNPLRHAFYIKAADPQQTIALAKKVEKYDNTYQVVYGEHKVKKLFNYLNTGRNVGLVLIIALLFTATFLISNTIRITITARGREIEIMKLVGATNNFVRMPFLFEGIWLGVLGAILPMVIVTITYSNLYNFFQPKIEGDLFQPLAVTPFIFQLNGLLLFMGILIGLWGSFMSVRKFLKV